MKNENEKDGEQFVEIEPTDTSSEKPQTGFKAWAKKFYSILFIALAVILLVGLGYQSVRLIQVTNAKEKERVLIQENVREVLLAKSKESLMLTMKPLVWAIRAEMLRGNMDQTNQYVNELVKVRNFNLVMVVSPNGTIEIASDKKLEGTRFTESFDGKYISVEESSIELVDSSVFHIASPVMGFDSKLGTLFIEYFPHEELRYKVPTIDVGEKSEPEPEPVKEEPVKAEKKAEPEPTEQPVSEESQIETGEELAE